MERTNESAWLAGMNRQLNPMGPMDSTESFEAGTVAPGIAQMSINDLFQMALKSGNAETLAQTLDAAGLPPELMKQLLSTKLSEENATEMYQRQNGESVSGQNGWDALSARAFGSALSRDSDEDLRRRKQKAAEIAHQYESFRAQSVEEQEAERDERSESESGTLWNEYDPRDAFSDYLEAMDLSYELQEYRAAESFQNSQAFFSNGETWEDYITAGGDLAIARSAQDIEGASLARAQDNPTYAAALATTQALLIQQFGPEEGTRRALSIQADQEALISAKALNELGASVNPEISGQYHGRSKMLSDTARQDLRENLKGLAPEARHQIFKNMHEITVLARPSSDLIEQSARLLPEPTPLFDLAELPRRLQETRSLDEDAYPAPALAQPML